MKRIPWLIAGWAVATPAALLAQRPDLLQSLGVADGATLERMIMVPMRDGVRLSTAVIRPKIEGRVPVVLVRTPYLKDSELQNRSLFARLVREGYAIVVQNERGTEWSEGRHQFLAGARNDGYDALTWIAAQPWSNGRVRAGFPNSGLGPAGMPARGMSTVPSSRLGSARMNGFGWRTPIRRSPSPPGVGWS